jgi:hypothetical protein
MCHDRSIDRSHALVIVVFNHPETHLQGLFDRRRCSRRRAPTDHRFANAMSAMPTGVTRSSNRLHENAAGECPATALRLSGTSHRARGRAHRRGLPTDANERLDGAYPSLDAHRVDRMHGYIDGTGFTRAAAQSSRCCRTITSHHGPHGTMRLVDHTRVLRTPHGATPKACPRVRPSRLEFRQSVSWAAPYLPFPTRYRVPVIHSRSNPSRRDSSLAFQHRRLLRRD